MTTTQFLDYLSGHPSTSRRKLMMRREVHGLLDIRLSLQTCA